MKNRIISDIKSDINPKTWLSKYRRTSVGYLMAMFLFYIGVGLVLGNGIGTPIIKNLIPHYQKPSDFLTSRCCTGCWAGGRHIIFWHSILSFLWKSFFGFGWWDCMGYY